MNPLRRKLILATWRPPTTGNIYGKLTVDASTALSYLDHLSRQSGEKITITHFAGRAVGEAIQNTPDINGFIRLGKFVPHKSVNISFLVALDGGKNLANAKICDVQKKNIVELAKELKTSVKKHHKGEDKEFKQSQNTLKWMPGFLVRPILWLTGFLTSSLGWSMKFLGLEAFPFGSCMITSVGMFGLDEGWAPHTPFARVPIIVLIGAVKDKPHVIDGELTVRPLLTLTATIDHRYIDGAQAANIANTIREAFEKPWILDGETEPPDGWELSNADS